MDEASWYEVKTPGMQPADSISHKKSFRDSTNNIEDITTYSQSMISMVA